MPFLTSGLVWISIEQFSTIGAVRNNQTYMSDGWDGLTGISEQLGYKSTAGAVLIIILDWMSNLSKRKSM